MVYYYPFVLRCLTILDVLASSARTFWDWLFTSADWGILGVISPIELLSFTLISSFLIVRVVLAINK